METNKRLTRSMALNSNVPGYTMLIPSSILFILINTIPFVYGISLSFTDKNFFKPNTGKFIGLGNYIKAFSSPDFIRILLYTVIYTVSAVFFAYVLGMCLALLLNRDIKGKNVFRAIALLPWLVPPAVSCEIWSWMLNDQIGIINRILAALGQPEPVLFLADPALARITVICVQIWKSYPFMMITLLGGLQSINKELYEPAIIDGASGIKTFFKITFPLLKPVSITSVSLMSIWMFNTYSFDTIYLLTKGGPVDATYVLPIESYNAAFFQGKIGYASAVALIMTILISIGILISTAIKARARAKI